MTDWNKALNSVAIVIELDGWPHSAQLIREAAEELERLQKGWESLEWESKQEIERLRAALENLEAWVEQTNPDAYEKWKATQEALDNLRHEIDVQCSSEYVERILKENERLRAALMRVESNIGYSKTFLQKIAREALK